MDRIEEIQIIIDNIKSRIFSIAKSCNGMGETSKIIELSKLLDSYTKELESL